MSTSIKPRPRPISRRGTWLLVIVGALLACAYAAVVHVYNAEGGSETVSELGATSAPGIIATIEPIALGSSADRATLNLRFDTQGTRLVDADNRLTANVRIALASELGTQEVKFPAGEPFGRFETEIGLDGELAFYPFDDHTGLFTVQADTYRSNADGSVTSTGIIPVGLQSAGSIAGWNAISDFPTEMGSTELSSMTFDRTFSTRAFALVLLALVMTLSAVSLFVGCLVFTNRRKAEITLMTWAGAVLFALPLLRNYLPYDPPVGVALDIYVYLWVIVAAVSAVILDVAAWLRQTRRQLEAEHEGRNAT